MGFLALNPKLTAAYCSLFLFLFGLRSPSAWGPVLAVLPITYRAQSSLFPLSSRSSGSERSSFSAFQRSDTLLQNPSTDFEFSCVSITSNLLGHLRPCVERGTQILRTEREVVFCDYRPYALAVMVYPSPTSLKAQGAKKQACLRDYLILGDGSGTMVGTWRETEKHQFHAPVGACLCEDFACRCTSCKHES